MMKVLTTLVSYFAIIIAFLMMPCVLMAQQVDAQRILMRVKYDISHIRDLDRPDIPHAESMLLLLGSSSALFTSYDRIVYNQGLMRQFEEARAMDPGNPPALRMPEGKPVSPADLYLFAGDRKFYVVENLYLNYLYEDDYPVIDWNIVGETRTIKGLECQKAVTNYKGREWHVWFTEQVPLPFGPWELGGLPGLILEASDLRQEIVFSFDGLETVTSIAGEEEDGQPKPATRNDMMSAEWIVLPVEKTKQVKKKDIVRLKEAAIKGPRQFMLTQMRGTEVIAMDNIIPIASWGRKIKNPIALKD